MGRSPSVCDLGQGNLIALEPQFLNRQIEAPRDLEGLEGLIKQKAS